jgi:hypothetical protein
LYHSEGNLTPFGSDDSGPGWCASVYRLSQIDRGYRSGEGDGLTFVEKLVDCLAPPSRQIETLKADQGEIEAKVEQL